MALIVLRAKSNMWEEVELLVPEILRVLETIGNGHVVGGGWLSQDGFEPLGLGKSVRAGARNGGWNKAKRRGSNSLNSL